MRLFVHHSCKSIICIPLPSFTRFLLFLHKDKNKTMQILLACAKHMTTRSEVSPELSTKPRFLKEASRHALQLAAFTEAELGKALKCNARLAILNKLRYLSFFRSRRQRGCRIILQWNGLPASACLGIYRGRLCVCQQPSVDLFFFIWPAPADGPHQELPFGRQCETAG